MSISLQVKKNSHSQTTIKKIESDSKPFPHFLWHAPSTHQKRTRDTGKPLVGRTSRPALQHSLAKTFRRMLSGSSIAIVLALSPSVKSGGIRNLRNSSSARCLSRDWFGRSHRTFVLICASSQKLFWLCRRLAKATSLVFSRYAIILDISRYFSTLLDITRYYSILLDIARYCSILLDITRYCSILLDNTY